VVVRDGAEDHNDHRSSTHGVAGRSGLVVAETTGISIGALRPRLVRNIDVARAYVRAPVA